MWKDFPGQAVPLQPRQVLWNEGDPSDFVAYLESGQLEIVRFSEQGEAAILNMLDPGEVLGEMSCIDGQPHSATVRSRGLSRVRRLPKADFIRWLQANPERWQSLLRTQSERLRRLTGRFVENSLDSVRRRLVRRLQESTGDVLEATHQELAEQLGTTRESVSKSLGELSRAGAIKCARGKIHILSRELLSV